MTHNSPLIASTVSLIPRPGQFPGIVFSPDGGEGAGDPPAGDPPAGDPPAGDPPANDPPAGDDASKAFLERLKRARAADQKKIFEDLGVTNLEDAKAKLARLNELETERLSEQEKLKKQAEESEKARKAAEDRASAAEAAARQKDRDRAFDRAATKAKLDPDHEETVKMLFERKLPELVAEGEEPTEETFATFLDGLKKNAKTAFYFEAEQTPAGTAPKPKGPQGGGSEKNDSSVLTAEEISKLSRPEFLEYAARVGNVHLP